MVKKKKKKKKDEVNELLGADYVIHAASPFKIYDVCSQNKNEKRIISIKKNITKKNTNNIKKKY